MTQFFQGRNTDQSPAQSTTLPSALTSLLSSQWDAVPLTSHLISCVGVICTGGQTPRTRSRDCTVEVESLQFAIRVSARVVRTTLLLLLFVLPVSWVAEGKKKKKTERIRERDEKWSGCLLSDEEGPIHHGVCSSWLNRIEKGEMVPCFVRG